MKNKLCKDNLICCDDNCQRCANLIYLKYLEQQEEINKLKKNNETLKKENQHYLSIII